MAWRSRMEDVESKLDTNTVRVMQRNASAPYVSCERTPSEQSSYGPSTSRQRAESPYVKGKKNSDYVNPTYQSNGFLNASNENLGYMRDQSYNGEDGRDGNEGNLPRSASMRADLRPQSANPYQSRRSSGVRTSGDVGNGKDVKVPTFGDINDESYEGSRDRLARKSSVGRNYQSNSARNVSSQVTSVDACYSCHNVQLKQDKDQREVKDAEYSKELDRQHLDYAKQLHEKSREQEELRRISLQKMAHHNLKVLKQKEALRQNGDDCFEGAAISSLHKNIIEKMFEGSERVDNQRREKAKQSLNYNKFKVESNDDKRGARDQDAYYKYAAPEKSFVDKMHESSASKTRERSTESRQTYKHNLNRSIESSPMPRNYDRESSSVYEEASNQLVKTRNQSNNEKPKNSFVNLKQYIKTQGQNSDGHPHSERAKSTGKAWNTRPNTRNNESSINSAAPTQSLLGKLYSNDDKGYNMRRQNSKDCLRYNQESALKGAPKSVDCDEWAEKSPSLNVKLSQKWQKQEQEREEQMRDCKNTLRRQIEEKLAKSREQEIKNILFQEKPLLVCSHKVSVTCCGLCNKKVPSKGVAQMSIQKRPSKITASFVTKRR